MLEPQMNPCNRGKTVPSTICYRSLVRSSCAVMCIKNVKLLTNIWNLHAGIFSCSFVLFEAFYSHSQNCEKRLLACHVCPLRSSVCMEQLGFHWADIHEIWYLRGFRKSVEKLQVSLKYYKNNGYFTWRRIYISGNISLNSSWNEKYLRQKL
jgi:hypothetical protein